MSAIGARPVSTGRLTLVPLAAGHADEMAAVLADPELVEPIADPGSSAPVGTAEQACASDENQDQPYAHQDG